MNNSYPSRQKIGELYGCEGLKAFADKLLLAVENAKRCSIKYPPLPNLILSASSGYGVTTHISLISGLLRETGLMRFKGEEEYFEMALSDAGQDLDRLLERVGIAAGFYGEFRGVIGLDVSAFFRNKTAFQDAGRLMEFVDHQQGKILFIFVIPSDPAEEKLAEFLHLFSSRTPAEVIRVPFPGNDVILSFTASQLERRHMTLSRGAEDALLPVLDMLRSDETFEGYQTIKNLVDELVWNKLTAPDGIDGVIRRSDILALSGNERMLGVVRKHLDSQKKNGQIGFVGK